MEGTKAKPRIMVVDGHDVERHATARMLRARGARVLEASTIEGALSERDDGVDAWVVDHKLPDGRGTNLLHIIRTEGSTAPALLVTNDGSISLAGLAAAFGATFHGKPLLPEVVDALVHDAERAIPIGRRLNGDLHLTERERDVVARRAEGVCRAGIASALNITEDAVKSRVRGILKKANMAGYACDTLDDLLLDAHRRRDAS